MTTIKNFFIKKFTLIDNIVNDLLGDVKSLRVWIIIGGFVFNGVTLWLCAFHGLDYKVAITAIGLLTIIFTYFFASKHAEAQAKSATASDDSDDSDDSTKA